MKMGPYSLFHKQESQLKKNLEEGNRFEVGGQSDRTQISHLSLSLSLSQRLIKDRMQRMLGHDENDERHILCFSLSVMMRNKNEKGWLRFGDV